MALPLDTSGVALSNRIVDEIHSVGTLEQRYIIPNKGSFFVNKLKVYNDANGQLLEPVTDYNTLQLNVEASNETLKEVAQIVFIHNLEVIRVRLTYQAVGTDKYEQINASVRPLINDFISGKTDNRIINAVAGQSVEILPRDFLSTPHILNSGAMIYTQLENIAEAVTSGDPSAVQAVYEFLINYTNGIRGEYTKKISDLRNRIDIIFKATELVNGQYLFTHEDLNPFVYLNYGAWVSNPNMLYWGGPADGVTFGQMKNVSNVQGLFAMKTMAYRRDDTAPPILYTLVANKTEVNEGESVTFTLTAPGLAAGTRINYVLGGVTNSDVSGGQLNGAFVLNASAMATATITLVEDATTDGDTNLILRLVQSPDVFALVKVNDTSQQIKYETYFSSDVAGTRVVQTVDEGQTGYLQIRTAGLFTDRTFFLLYTDSTINDNDTGAKPSSVLVTNNTATVPILFKNDFVTEGNETLVVNLCVTQNINSRIVRTTLQVNDTSKTPTLTSFWSGGNTSNDAISQINEGQQVFLRIKTTNLPNGSVVNLTYAGTANASDFTSTLPTSVSILNNEVTVQYNISADGATEGDEVFTVTASLADVPAIADTKSLTIKDTSVGYMLDSAKYSNTSDGTQIITSATIPTNIYLYIQTRGFANGDKVYVDLSGSDATVKALLTSLTAVVSISNNVGSVLLTLDDNRGLYTAVGQLKATISNYRDNAIGAQLGVVPTFSVNPRLVPTARLTAMDSNNVALTQIGEGTTLKIKVEATNIPNGSNALPVRYSGTATADDFSNVLPTTVTITNGVGWLEYNIKADSKIEGTETFIVTVDLPYTGGSSSIQVSILDTSLPIVNVRWTSDVAGNNTITAANEGTTAYLQVRTSGFADNTILNLDYSGQAITTDVTGTRPTTVNIISGTGVVPYTFTNDYLEEGSETMAVSLSYQNISLNATATILINDTSLPGAVGVKWSRNITPTAAVGNLVFNEGETAYLHIETKNLATGTELQLQYTGTANADDFAGGLPTIVTVAGTWTTIPYLILEDLIEEAGVNENLFVNVTYRTVSAATPSAISIVDTTSHVLAKNGEVKEVMLVPGAKYLVIVQGGGGSAGRGLSTSTVVPGKGHGNRGTLSKATVMDNTAEVFNIYGFGGGKGYASSWGLAESDANGYLNEAGGYALVDTTLPTIDGINTSGFISNQSESFCFPGMGSGYPPILWNIPDMDASSLAGFNHSRGFKLPLSSITNAIWETYGGGGHATNADGATGVGGYYVGNGGAAGGTYVGIITNPTSRPLKLRLTAGVGGITDNTNANGGVGYSGGPGQGGCVFITRVASNYSIRTNNKVANKMAASYFSAQQMAVFNGNTYPGNKLTVPPGKRLTASLVSAIPDLNKIPANDYTGAFTLYLLKAEGRVYWAGNQNNGNPATFMYASYWPSIGGSLFSAMDEGGVFKRLFKRAQSRAGCAGFPKNTTFVPYLQGIGIPPEYSHLVVDYPDNDSRRLKNGSQPDFGCLAHNFSETFTTDNPSGRGTFWPAINKYISGGPRIHVEVANTTTQDIVLAPAVVNNGYVEATLYYHLEDI